MLSSLAVHVPWQDVMLYRHIASNITLFCLCVELEETSNCSLGFFYEALVIINVASQLRAFYISLDLVCCERGMLLFFVVTIGIC